jgi:hypothetical protein
MAKLRIFSVKCDQIRYNPVIGYSPFILIDQVSSDAMSPTENANDAAQNAGTDTAGQGPPVDLPDVVPDFVSDLLATISESGVGLGEAISETASSANPAAVAAGVADVAAAVPL